MGTIASGSSDASVRLFTLTSVASDFQEMPLVAPMQDLTFQEMLDTDDVVMASSAQPLRPPVTDISATPGGISGSDRFGTTMLRAEEGPTCWTECICPPGLSKPNASQCMRCWNRGHTNLVRTVCLQDDVVITGSYDATVKVSDIFSSRMLVYADKDRCGTERPVNCSMT
jgi:WD40 repeat protein